VNNVLWLPFIFRGRAGRARTTINRADAKLGGGARDAPSWRQAEQSRLVASAYGEQNLSSAPNT